MRTVRTVPGSVTNLGTLLPGGVLYQTDPPTLCVQKVMFKKAKREGNHLEGTSSLKTSRKGTPAWTQEWNENAEEEPVSQGIFSSSSNDRAP